MRLTVFNGSPRGTGSNTSILLGHFLKGFNETEGNSCELIYLNRADRQDEFVEIFRNAETVLLAFPLYTDAMPAMVKTFIESLAPLKGREGNASIGFIVQSGFPEPVHTMCLERYLEKLAKRLGCPWFGTAVRGGVEGIQAMPPERTRKLFESFYSLGKDFGANGKFDPQIVNSLARRDRYPADGRSAGITAAQIKGSDMYWDSLLRKNGVYENRYAQPYTDSPE
jgi:NAD(P)H-dependent FMN reductase